MNDTELKALYEDIRVEIEYFDTIDLFPLMEENMLIADLMDKIEEKYNDDFISKTGSECLFNLMSGDELVDYLRDRYSDKISIDTSYREYIHLK